MHYADLLETRSPRFKNEDAEWPLEANLVGISAKPFTTTRSESGICALDR
jgi:hypothetical protein